MYSLTRPKFITLGHAVLTVGIFLFAASCNGGKALVIKGYALNPVSPVTKFVAGAAEQEITPYPGIPMGGHGLAGRIARGTWMPLYARAFIFKTHPDMRQQSSHVSCLPFRRGSAEGSLAVLAFLRSRW